MSIKEPKVIIQKGKKDVVIEVHSGITICYDDEAFKVYFGVCDSGSTFRFRVESIKKK